MKLSLQVKLGHGLSMTPQLQQAIRLLQLSNMQLQEEIQQTLESNIMLEKVENSTTEEPISEDIEDPVTQAPDPLSEPENIPDQLDIDSDWEDIYEADSNADRINLSTNVNNLSANLENQISYQNTLQEHLLWQLNFTHISETDKMIAETITDALDDRGYLNCSLDDICGSLNDSINTESTDPQGSIIELDEVAAVLHLIHTLDPVGIGAIDLRECLLLQLRQCHKDMPFLDLAIVVVTEYMEVLAKKDFNQLMEQLKVDKEELQQALALIRSMDPHPGRQINETRTEYIEPDVYVKKVGENWKATLNDDLLPDLRINNRYAGMIRRADNRADNLSLKSHLQEAKWFIRSLCNRNETLLRVATCIVEKQQAFIEYGEEAMQPMVLHDIAEALGMHGSTISRAVTRKYMHTPRGLFEFKYFFSSHLSTNCGGTTSSTATRALIKKLIAGEMPERPLSDYNISILLLEQGIKVARRTVGKYRDAMAIPTASERRHLA